MKRKKRFRTVRIGIHVNPSKHNEEIERMYKTLEDKGFEIIDESTCMTKRYDSGINLLTTIKYHEEIEES